MTETLNNIKRDYPTFEFKDSLPWATNAVSCQNDLYYLTIHDYVELEVDRFAVVATEVNGPIHYVKRFSSVAGLRLYLTSVMVLGI